MFRRPEFLGSLWGLGAVSLFVVSDTPLWLRVAVTAVAYCVATAVGMVIGLSEAHLAFTRANERMAAQLEKMDRANNNDHDPDDSEPIILPMPSRHTTNQTAS